MWSFPIYRKAPKKNRTYKNSIPVVLLTVINFKSTIRLHEEKSHSFFPRKEFIMKLHTRRRWRLLLLITGIILTVGALTACGSKADPTETTVETTQESTEDQFSLGNIDVEVSETEPETLPDTEIETVIATIEDGGIIGVSATGETVYDMGRYGDLGKSFFDSIASSWVDWSIETEEDLRLIVDSSYGNLPTKEELTQEILAMERNAKPVPETQAVVQETKAAPQETQVASNKTQEQQPTQVAPQQSQAQQPAPQEAQVSQTGELPPEVQARIDARKAYDEANPMGDVDCTTPGGSPTDIVDDIGITWH